MVTADISTLTQSLLGVASVVTPLLVAFASKEICSYLKISSTAAAAQHVQAGVEALADLAVDAMRTAATNNQTLALNDAVATAVKEVSQQLTNAANVAGTTPENLVARITSIAVSKLAQIESLSSTPTKAGA